MKLVIDTCSAIFISNGEVCDAVLQLPKFTFVVGDVVRAECGRLARLIDLLEKKDLIGRSADIEVPASRFGELIDKYDLGDGETECLAIAEYHDFNVCTDDRRARKVCVTHLGEARVIGVLYILRECVCRGLLSKARAVTAYELMKVRGAFLPDLAAGYFD